MNKYIILPLILVLFSLTSCGGSSKGSHTEQTSPRTASGMVTLPAGSAMSMNDVSVHGILGVSKVKADGSYTVPEPGSGPALVTLTDPSGNVMLMGMVDPDDPQMGAITPMSTATLLMFFGIGANKLPSENWKETLTLIAAEEKVKDLAGIIEQRLSADSAALQNSDQAIMDAVTEACSALSASTKSKSTVQSSYSVSDTFDITSTAYPKTMAHAMRSKGATDTPVEITVPDSNLSGVQVTPDIASDGIVITNTYRRHCWYWVYYVGYQDTSGTDHMLSSALWELRDNGYLKSTNALGGVVGTSIDYAWGKIPYIPVKIGPIGLGTLPSDAKKAYYKVIVAGGTTFINYLPPSWVSDNVNVDEFTRMQNLMGQITMIKDYLMPTLFAFIPTSKLNGFSGKQLGDFSAGMIGIIVKGGINVTLNAVDQKYDDICWTILKAVLSEGSIRNGICEYVGSWLLGAVLTDQAVKDIGSTAKFLADAIKSCDKVLLGVDLAAVSSDIAKSRGYDYFDVIAVKPEVRIDPSAVTVMPGNIVTFNAIKGTVTGDSFEYRWSVNGSLGVGAGSLRTHDGTTYAASQTTTVASIVYKASDAAPDQSKDTLKVELYRKQVTDSGVVTQFIGSDQAEITVSNPQTTVSHHFNGPYFLNSPHSTGGGIPCKGYVVWFSYTTWSPIPGNTSGYRLTWEEYDSYDGHLKGGQRTLPLSACNTWLRCDGELPPADQFPAIANNLFFVGCAAALSIDITPDENMEAWNELCADIIKQHKTLYVEGSLKVEEL